MHIKYYELIRANSDSNFGTQYIVEPNDNLYEIASRFDTTVNKLKELNHMKSDLLHPGEIIIVDNIYNPNNEDLYKRYTVQKNDTIYSIAYNYGMTPNEVLEINNMLKDDIQIGETIFVYNNPPLLTNEVIYIVKKGDSLYSIAQEYNTTIKQIMDLNHLDNDFLSLGTKLFIKAESPQTTAETDVYTVIPGDSLYSISINHNSSIDELKKINNLSSDNLTIGQQILVPKRKENEIER